MNEIRRRHQRVGEGGTGIPASYATGCRRLEWEGRVRSQEEARRNRIDDDGCRCSQVAVVRGRRRCVNWIGAIRRSPTAWSRSLLHFTCIHTHDRSSQPQSSALIVPCSICCPAFGARARIYSDSRHTNRRRIRARYTSVTDFAKDPLARAPPTKSRVHTRGKTTEIDFQRREFLGSPTGTQESCDRYMRRCYVT